MNTITRVVKAKRMEPARVLRDPVINHIHPRQQRTLAREVAKAKLQLEAGNFEIVESFDG